MDERAEKIARALVNQGRGAFRPAEVESMICQAIARYKDEERRLAVELLANARRGQHQNPGQFDPYGGG